MIDKRNKIKKGSKIRKGFFIAPSVFEGRKLTKTMWEEAVYKYMHMPRQKLLDLLKEPGEIPAFELMVMSILARAISLGKNDTSRAEFLLNRIIGKVPEVFHHKDTTSEDAVKMMAEKLLEVRQDPTDD